MEWGAWPVMRGGIDKPCRIASRPPHKENPPDTDADMVETYVQPLNLQGDRNIRRLTGSRSRPIAPWCRGRIPTKNYWWAYAHPHAVKFWT